MKTDWTFWIITSMSKKKEKLAWKREEGWVQFNPPPKHPQYEEWIKRKEKEDGKTDGDN